MNIFREFYCCQWNVKQNGVPHTWGFYTHTAWPLMSAWKAFKVRAANSPPTPGSAWGLQMLEETDWIWDVLHAHAFLYLYGDCLELKKLFSFCAFYYLPNYHPRAHTWLSEDKVELFTVFPGFSLEGFNCEHNLKNQSRPHSLEERHCLWGGRSGRTHCFPFEKHCRRGVWRMPMREIQPFSFK